jgi:hypothetical protein
VPQDRHRALTYVQLARVATKSTSLTLPRATAGD